MGVGKICAVGLVDGGAIVHGAGGEGFVGVDSCYVGARRKRGELLDFPGVDVCLVDGYGDSSWFASWFSLRVEDAGCFVADHNGVNAVAETRCWVAAGVGWVRWVGDKEPRLFGGESENVDAVGSGVDELFPVRGVVVDVEVKGGGAGFVGEAIDTVARIFVDPGGGEALRMSEWRERG